MLSAAIMTTQRKCFIQKTTSSLLSARSGVDRGKLDDILTSDPESGQLAELMTGREWERVISALGAVQDWVDCLLERTGRSIDQALIRIDGTFLDPVFGASADREPSEAEDRHVKSVLKLTNLFYFAASENWRAKHQTLQSAVQ